MLKYFSGLNSQEWSILSKQEMVFLVNNFTMDEFRHEKVNSNSWHLLDIYKARSQYTIPHTPQIMLSN